jgi:surface-anchored protein
MKTTCTIFLIASSSIHAGLIPIGEHVDIRWRWESPAAWSCQAVTDSNGETAYDTEEVFFPLSDKPYVAGAPSNSGARFTQPASTNFAFTGVQAGQPLWIAVQGTPGIGEAWPGLENNQSAGTFGSYIPNDIRVSQTSARPWIKISLHHYSPPQGTDSHFSMWTTSGSVPKVWMSTHDLSVVNDYYYAEGTHTHMNWGFSALGIHRVEITASAYLGPGATNPTAASAVHTLTFAVGPFAQWQAFHFGNAGLDDPSIFGSSADPDHDGLKNLVEFAFGLDPNRGDASPVSPGLGFPVMSIVEEEGVFFETLTYPRRKAGNQIAPLIYQPQFASSPSGDWELDGITTTTTEFPAGQEVLNQDWELATSRRAIGNSVPARRFARVALEHALP